MGVLCNIHIILKVFEYPLKNHRVVKVFVYTSNNYIVLKVNKYALNKHIGGYFVNICTAFYDQRMVNIV